MNGRLTACTIIIAILALVNAYFFIVVIRPPVEGSGAVFTTAQAFIAPPNPVSYLPLLDTSVRDVNLDAKSAIIYDVKSDRNLFEKNINVKLPVASLTKILNAVVVWEKFSPNDQVTVQASAVKVDGEKQDLYLNETLSINNLIQLMLVESSNDAAYALRDYAASQQIDLVKEMNLKVVALGMRDTQFLDVAGLNDSGYSTASDLVKAVRYALRYDAIWNFSRELTATVDSSDGKISHVIKNTNQLLGVLSDIIGGKTGYTESALGCIILIVDAAPKTGDQNGKIIAIVLGSHNRFEDMKNLITWAKRAYRW